MSSVPSMRDQVRSVAERAVGQSLAGSDGELADFDADAGGAVTHYRGRATWHLGALSRVGLVIVPRSACPEMIEAACRAYAGPYAWEALSHSAREQTRGDMAAALRASANAVGFPPDA